MVHRGACGLTTRAFAVWGNDALRNHRVPLGDGERLTLLAPRSEQAMTYDEWEASVPEHIRADAMWGLRVYRSALYAGELGRSDAALLMHVGGYDHLADQLARSTASISVNIAEGYSRFGRRDRGRFYEYALGSAREARDWYYKASEPLGPTITDARMSLHTTLVRILTVLVRRARTEPVVEPAAKE
jgi:four helix bundle protein